MNKTRKKPIAAFLLIISLIFTVTLSGCSSIEELLGKRTEPETQYSASFLTQPAEAKAIAIALDVSGSTDDKFPESVRIALYKKVLAYIPKELESVASTGVQGYSGLDLVIYLINSVNANNYNKQDDSCKLIIKIPGVPAIEKKPTPPISPDLAYYDAEILWTSEFTIWKEAYAASVATANEEAEKIKNMDFTIKTTGKASGIYNSIYAAVSALDSNKVSIGVFSDLFENGTDAGAQVMGKTGSVVFVVPAPDGNISAANKRADEFNKTLMSWGFNEARVFVPDSLLSAIDELFR